jgi:hypothetical protein
MRCFRPDSGIAIGPILFVIALLALIGTILATGTTGFGTASVADRVYNDMYSQTNLIRTKINECNIKYLTTGTNGDGYPPDASGLSSTGTPVCALTCEGDPSSTETGNDCLGNTMTKQNLWYGIRPTVLPPPTSGMDQWYYHNGGASGGRCIWAKPSTTISAGINQGLTQAASKFSGQEVIFNSSGGGTPKFVIWVTYPTGTADALCSSP